jgi:hypothetical protein
VTEEEVVEAPLIECRQWWCSQGLVFCVVVAATKEDAKTLAERRFDQAGSRGLVIRARPATTKDLAAYEQGLRARPSERAQ